MTGKSFTSVFTRRSRILRDKFKSHAPKCKTCDLFTCNRGGVCDRCLDEKRRFEERMAKSEKATVASE